jgi:serine/threonine-protein kinase Chk1
VLGVKYKDAPIVAGSRAVHRLRVGGYDKRKIMFKGWIELEVFSRMQVSGAFCVMQRDVVRRRVRAWGRFWADVIPLFFFRERAIRFLGDSFGRR